MSVATGSVEMCEKAYLDLERELDCALELFVATVEDGHAFHEAMGKVQQQLAHAEKLHDAQNDLELNETVVLADKIEGDLHVVERLTKGAVLSSGEEKIAETLESTRGALERMGTYLKKMKSASGEGEHMEVRSAIISFRKHAKACQQKIGGLHLLMAPKKHHIYSQVNAAKKRVQKLKSGVGAAFENLARKRLKKKTNETKLEIADFMKKAGSGKIFVDHKHLTLSSNSNFIRIPLTQSVRFALEEMAPIGDSLARIGKVTVSGKYETDGQGVLLRIGERALAGDSIIYREKTCRLNF